MAMTISIDDELKEDFTEVCREIGLTPSAAMGVFAKRVVRDRAIPFLLSAGISMEYDPQAFEHRLAERLDESWRQVQRGEYVTHEEMLAARTRQNGKPGSQHGEAA